jgi:superkiller protein 3
LIFEEKAAQPHRKAQILVHFTPQTLTKPIQLTETLSLYLPTSPFYSTLSTLAPPDPTQPNNTTTYAAQCAIHNSLPVIEEIVALMEKEEGDRIKRDVDSRRKRLNAAGPEEVKREVGREVYSISKVRRTTRLIET